ncbi:MAG TPA: SsrA-binding protein, partial [Chthoniobacteraceae bacterium]
QPYAKANSFDAAEPKRRRKLLVHRKEVDRLAALSQIKGHTLVALRMYWKGHRVKVEIGVGKGKEKADQRADLKAKATKREVDREVSNFNRKHG